MKSAMRFLLLAVFASATPQTFAWTFDGNVIFVSNGLKKVARAPAVGFSENTETFAYMIARTNIIEEGTTVDSDEDTCTRARPGVSLFCGVLAEDPTLTNTCKYCIAAAAAVPSPGSPLSRGIGKCTLYQPTGGGGGL